MGFVSYLYLILLISDQIFEVTVAHENFWKLNGPSVLPGDAAHIQRNRTSLKRTYG